MNITFLGQGYEPLSTNSVGNHLLQFLSDIGFHTFTGISAFASEAGVFGLSGYIQSAKQNFKNLTLIVGIDQEGTSKEALEEILNLGIKSYIFYQSEAPIFHPKIYLFEGDKEVKLIIGSSNLTGRGLFTNVESSLLIEFDMTDKEGLALLAELKTYYKSLFDYSDANLFKVSQDVIDDFNAKGIVPYESERRRIYAKRTSVTSTTTTPTTNNFIVPKRITAKIPASFPSKVKRRVAMGTSSPQSIFASKQVIRQHPTSSPSSPNFTQARILLWESGPLTERDLNIPKGLNTNNTGSMLIKKGLLKNIDQRHYFRDTVFASLNWVKDAKPNTAHYERAMAKFRIIVEGTDFGIFELRLSHNTKTDTISYKDKNSMTSISWGDAKQIVAKQELIGKSASLYDSDKIGEFILEIK